jgi:RNA polymerase sigma factor (sigma-70 family)
MNAEETYLENLRTIERIAAFVARKNHLKDFEAEEFIQEVRVRLLENDYSIIRKHEGRSKISTYLTTVISRLFAQWRTEQWGKWRPSAEAKRLGEPAITLERLLSRDGYSFSEAARLIMTPSGSSYTVRQLEALYLRLPVRTPRPIVVSGDEIPDIVSVPDDASQRIEAGERAHKADRTAEVLDELMRRLDPEDQLILSMRFWHERGMPDIARILHLDQKKLYKRQERLLKTLRRDLESAGVSREDVKWLLAAGEEEIHLKFNPSGEIPPPGPSHRTGRDKARRREGRIR